MYSPTVCQRNLEKALPVIRKQLNDPTFEYRYHSVKTVTQANAHFSELLEHDDKGNSIQKRPFNPEESRWVANESDLCRFDFEYFRSHYAKIRDIAGNIILATPNVAQRIMASVRTEAEDRGIGIDQQDLKGRQLGDSTDKELCVAHRAIFYSNVNAVVASSDPDKSEKMAGMIDLCFNELPFFLKPTVTDERKGKEIGFGHQNSYITIEHGTQFTGIARGTTPDVVHLCLAPSTPIRLANGFVKPIRELRPGDLVITASGVMAPIKAVCKSARRHEIATELWLWGNFHPLICTRDHPVLSASGWVEASSLRNGDFVRYPIRPITQERREFKAKVLVGQRVPERWPDRTYPLDFNWGRVVGLYLAEGSIQRRIHGSHNYACSVVFTCHKDETVDFSEAISSAAGKCPTTRPRKTSKTTQLALNDSMLARWILEQFGEKDDKRIPDWVWQAEDFGKGIVCGYLEGDGHIPEYKLDIPATSVRLQLLTQLRELVASLGYGWSSLYHRTAGVYYNRNCRESWLIYFSGSTAKKLRESFGWKVPERSEVGPEHWHYVPDADFIEIEVERNHDSFSEDFWDIEVDSPEHSFTTLQCTVKNSEVSEYDNANELIDASLRKAIHHSPMLFIVLESTAKGMRNWWHKEWLKNKDLWPRGMSTTRPVFLPWHVGTDIWPTVTWLRQCPIPANYIPSDAVIRHAEKCRAYVISNDLLTRHLGSNWILPRYQMWFYDCMLEEARRKNTLNKFLEEMPGDDMEAFQHTGAGVFSVELIQAYRDRIREPLGVYKLQAPVAEVPLLLQPTAGEIDHNKKPIEVRCHWNTSRPPYDYRLVPVKWNGYQEDSGLDKIYIWEYPQDNVEYIIGADGSAGIGLDRTAIGVDKQCLPGRPYAQVCEFASDRTNAVDAWPLLLALGTYYSTKQKNERRQIMCVCEVMSETDLTQLELRKRGWYNFPEWGRIDQRDMSHTSHRLGWHTTPWSRRQIIAWLISLVRNFDIEVPSPFLVEEIADLMGDEESQKIKAVHGGHDDRVLRIAFTFFARNYKTIMDGQWTLDGARRFAEKKTPSYSRYVPGLAERALSEDEGTLMGLIDEYERHGGGFDRHGY